MSFGDDTLDPTNDATSQREDDWHSWIDIKHAPTHMWLKSRA